MKVLKSAREWALEDLKPTRGNPTSAYKETVMLFEVGALNARKGTKTIGRVTEDTEVEVGAEIVTTIQGGEMDMERTTRIDLDLGLGKGCEDVGHEAEIGSIMGEVTKDEENLGRTAAVRPTTIIIGTGRGRVTINDGSEGRPLLTRLASRWR